MTNWTVTDIPPQHGRSVVITGTGGLGFEDALALARAGGEIILAGRDPQKGVQAVARIRHEVPKANITFERVDLASLRSITEFGARLSGTRDSLDLLINNAAVMMPPKRQATSDGFEMQFGTNYLGHFALTAHLLPLLREGKNPRVVSVAAIAVRAGVINFDDLQAERSYKPMTAYSQSKLANLLFAIELQRRSTASDWGITSIAAHPGISRTDLVANGVGSSSALGLIYAVMKFMFQPAAQGALPTLYAATASVVTPGGYYGPNKMNEFRGNPAPAHIPPRAENADVARHLWEVSEQLTGVTFD